MKIEALSLAEMRTHRSEKWRGFPSDVLPLFVAEMDFPVAQPIQEILMQMISHSDMGYLSSIPELGKAFSDFSKRHWNWDVNPEYVRLCTDVGVGMVEVLRATTQPGDKVLVNSPIYQNFYNWINETKVELIDVPFIQDGLNWSVDFDEIEKVYASGLKVHALCSPHNPLGRIYSRGSERCKLRRNSHQSLNARRRQQHEWQREASFLRIVRWLWACGVAQNPLAVQRGN